MLETSSAPAARGRILAAGPEAVAAAAAALAEGDIVGMPTETVYGLAADATRGEAVARIYEAKGRPAFNPLIAHVPGLAEAEAHGFFDADARRLAAAFWPGPMTLVVPFRQGSEVSALARAGLDSLALRAPSHPVAQALLRAFGRPLAAPSANPSGRVSPTTAAAVAAGLGQAVALVLDGGPAEVGLESTIVECRGGPPRLLRPGGVTREAIEAALGRPLAEPETGALRAPGLLASHYAPAAAVRLAAATFAADEAVLAFGPMARPALIPPERYLNLSPAGDLREAAANLFEALRRLDATRPAAIAAAPIPGHGLGEAINDRLLKAAAPRG
jgi:L-threonylcarbamoyladenylate synthase